MSLVIDAISEWESSLVDLLVASGSLAVDDAKAALADAPSLEQSVVLLLAERDLVATATSLRLLATISGLATVDLAAAPPEWTAQRVVPSDLARRFGVLGYRIESGALILACTEPIAPAVATMLQAEVGLPLGQVVLADAALIELAIDEHASAPEVETTEDPSPDAALARSYALHPSHGGRDFGVLDDLLRYAAEQGASDLHLSTDFPPAIRVDGSIRPLPGAAPLEPSALKTMVFDILSPAQREQFEMNRELDTSYSIVGVGRFRVSVFQQKSDVGSVLRLIPNEVPEFDTLGLPPVIAGLAQLRRGLVLVTGPTGSGKSTTLASIIDVINQSKPLHIMTAEDPIEFVHSHKTAIVNQREVGLDTRSFGDALRHVLRQDPDVILLGEMRDLETMSAAITAAETGHLVFSTLHTQDAPQSIDRIIDSFPATQQPQIRIQLASALEAVVTQQLVIAKSGTGRVPVTEVMLCTPGVKNLIRTGKTHQLYSLIQTGGEFGMQTMDLGLARAVTAGLISESVAFDRSHNASELREYLAEAAHGQERVLA